MSGLNPSKRVALIAVMAALGIALLGEGTAKACGSKPERVKLSCCMAAAASSCGGCCSEGGATRSESTGTHEARLSPQGGSRLASPVRNCECRSQAPAAPTSKHESDERTQRVDDLVTELLAADAEAKPSRRPPTHVGRFLAPSRTPLYLRVSRLLI